MSWLTLQLLLFTYAFSKSSPYSIIQERLHSERTKKKKLSCFVSVLEARSFRWRCNSDLLKKKSPGLNKSYANIENERTRMHNTISSGSLEVVCAQMWAERAPLKSQLSSAIPPCWFALRFCLYCISLMGFLEAFFFLLCIHTFYLNQ